MAKILEYVTDLLNEIAWVEQSIDHSMGIVAGCNQGNGFALYSLNINRSRFSTKTLYKFNPSLSSIFAEIDKTTWQRSSQIISNGELGEPFEKIRRICISAGSEYHSNAIGRFR